MPDPTDLAYEQGWNACVSADAPDLGPLHDRFPNDDDRLAFVAGYRNRRAYLRRQRAILARQ